MNTHQPPLQPTTKFTRTGTTRPLATFITSCEIPLLATKQSSNEHRNIITRKIIGEHAMGKKSKLKRERRLKSVRGKSRTRETLTNQDTHQLDFSHRVSNLKELFSKFNAEDVCVSLCASDLWLPNISSQVKHHFALGVFLSMEPNLFDPESRIDTYESFNNLIVQVHSALPSFPMLEDYIPEPDWGEIKIHWQGDFFQIFYGNSIERIPDYVEAFRLKFSGTAKNVPETKLSAPLDDLHAALLIQDYLVTNIDKSIVGTAEEIHPGHIEIPSEQFWCQCRLSLQRGATTFDNILCGSDLVLVQGAYKMPHSLSAFGEALFNGTSMPAMLAKIGNIKLPISPRNAIGVVLDYWENSNRSKDFVSDENLDGHISVFLEHRIQSQYLIHGSFKLATRHKLYERTFSAAILGQQKIYFLIALESEHVEQLLQIEKDIYEITTGGKEWAILHKDSPGVTQLQGRNITSSDVEIIAIVPHASPQFIMINRNPESIARILFLPDFVTIFDSIDEINELENFWKYVDDAREMVMPMLGTIDLFASFRDSHSVLVDGAMAPNLVVIDPHWGSSWRYKQLAEFWSVAPKLFPEDDNIAWKIKPPSNGSLELEAKAHPTLAHFVPISDCVVYFSFDADIQVLNVPNGRLLELFTHCIADSLAQRNDLVSHLPLFQHRRIVTKCRPNLSTLVKEAEEPCDTDKLLPLLVNWAHTTTEGGDFCVEVEVNLNRVQSKLTNPCDASFEVECLCDWIAGLCDTLGQVSETDIFSKIAATSTRKPRFMLSPMERTVDVPDYGMAEVPTQMHYKLARKDIAILFQRIGAEPGRYELAEAKALIDPVKEMARQLIHEQIARFAHGPLLTFCIEQHDILVASHSNELTKIRISMSHDVDYDRSQRLAELHENFIKNSKNYRYMLECCLSSDPLGEEIISSNEAIGLIAKIDWLFVLYNASDVLHNGIDVAGIELDNSFVPEIFYSKLSNDQEESFGLESANFKLGLGLEPNDRVESLQESGQGLGRLDTALLRDAGFSFTHLVQTLIVLSRWASVRDEGELRFFYQATRKEIAIILSESIENIDLEEAERVIEFITLEPKQIRRLIGKGVDESDVPVWEHNKRGTRYTLKPLVPTAGKLSWGAATAKRSFDLWTSTVADGYLPADFPWPNVKSVIRDIKEGIEKELEVRASEVCARSTQYIIGGIDFKCRFPKEDFEDVGDFDVLAYWPDTNQWLAVECKYNQPPFCIKDGRRLRERIFGIDGDHAQFSKIERRRKFLYAHLDRLRKLLKWPSSDISTPSFHEAYVSREIYWWMRNPPYTVPTEFVRIDALHNWLCLKNLL
jgi:hypothetical protein